MHIEVGEAEMSLGASPRLTDRARDAGVDARCTRDCLPHVFQINWDRALRPTGRPSRAPGGPSADSDSDSDRRLSGDGAAPGRLDQ
jgi:hypothetical protein